MSSAQSLPEWFQSRINTIYTASDDAARTAALDALLSPAVSVQHNEETLDAQEIRQRVHAQTAASARTDVKWNRAEETSPGQLEGQYVLTVSSKFRVRAAPMQRFITVDFAATVAEDPYVQGDDKRRVVSLKEQEEIKQAPIHLARIPQQGEQGNNE
ncbi:hypothetical protein K488DRAFT_71258 [Vararia minispora EC-137]|uniref:Uncharacterized protein n=1 Tax=Vararia minispora EC-137 TaxID=1314806 RepID=A0ACB8QIU1_9AGAM|nr:hypothetical protein K488DRAFT_71258 [Vararia minispora EC-137]